MYRGIELQNSSVHRSGVCVELDHIPDEVAASHAPPLGLVDLALQDWLHGRHSRGPRLLQNRGPGVLGRPDTSDARITRLGPLGGDSQPRLVDALWRFCAVGEGAQKPAPCARFGRTCTPRPRLRHAIQARGRLAPAAGQPANIRLRRDSLKRCTKFN